MMKRGIATRGMLCALPLCISAQVSFAQAPGWSRGQQNLAITYDECVRRAPAALQAEGYRLDYGAGDFAVGIKDVHTAVIMCSPAPDSKMFAHIVVASNGDGGGTERLHRTPKVAGTDGASRLAAWAVAGRNLVPGRRSQPTRFNQTVRQLANIYQ